jgi:TatD DNase family protein
MVTFKKNDALREVARHIPADRLLVETDTPYLSPEPYRGKPNEPSRVIHTGACLAAVCGVAEEDLARQTTATARRVFRLSGQPTSAHGNG